MSDRCRKQSGPERPRLADGPRRSGYWSQTRRPLQTRFPTASVESRRSISVPRTTDSARPSRSPRLAKVAYPEAEMVPLDRGYDVRSDDFWYTPAAARFYLQTIRRKRSARQNRVSFRACGKRPPAGRNWRRRQTPDRAPATAPSHRRGCAHPALPGPTGAPATGWH